VELDWCVGELIATVERLGLTENTLMIFCSDNGPVLDDGYQDGAVEKLGDHKPAGPFRGGKYTVFEGGTRTPLITRWPGRIQPGVSDEIVCTIDFAASLAALAAVELPADSCRDSFNVLGALLGDPGAKGREHLVQQDNGQRGNFGLRVGDWKLVRHAPRQSGRRKKQDRPQEVALFHLSEDPGEERDVAEQHGDMVTRMNQQLDDLIEAGRSRPPQ
jgi:arylsulfatase A